MVSAHKAAGLRVWYGVRVHEPLKNLQIVSPESSVCLTVLHIVELTSRSGLSGSECHNQIATRSRHILRRG